MASRRSSRLLGPSIVEMILINTCDAQAVYIIVLLKTNPRSRLKILTALKRSSFVGILSTKATIIFNLILNDSQQMAVQRNPPATPSHESQVLLVLQRLYVLAAAETTATGIVGSTLADIPARVGTEERLRVRAGHQQLVWLHEGGHHPGGQQRCRCGYTPKSCWNCFVSDARQSR